MQKYIELCPTCWAASHLPGYPAILGHVLAEELGDRCSATLHLSQESPVTNFPVSVIAMLRTSLLLGGMSYQLLGATVLTCD